MARVADVRLSDAQLNIIRFCSIECELQVSGERSVEWMIRAWMYAIGRPALPAEDDVLTLGQLIEPTKNVNGYRKVGVRVGWDVKLDPPLVPAAMRRLLDVDGRDGPAEWFRQYEEIHPFIDGNGRSGQILYNWLAGTLTAPSWAPNFWNDPRRSEGFGA